MTSWVVPDTVLLTRGAVDPYRFIFRNLILSMIVAIQAAIITMSQNRAAERDRTDASQACAGNLEAEIGAQLDRIERHLGLDSGKGKTA